MFCHHLLIQGKKKYFCCKLSIHVSAKIAEETRRFKKNQETADGLKPNDSVIVLIFYLI